jgi:hypothetical protein
MYYLIPFMICGTVTNFEISCTQTTTNQFPSESYDSPEECTMVIVTGTAAKNGKSLLMKNRDLNVHSLNEPVQYNATEETYAFVAVNFVGMGINEKGLAIANTYVPVLAESEQAGAMNTLLNEYILEHCEKVSEVISQLQDVNGPIGPNGRTENYTVATCIGVIDSFGVGAFIEISNSRISLEIVENSYQSRANHPRTFPGLASGPNGRDQYALDACETIMQTKGAISARDLAQNVSRYVRSKEITSNYFFIDGEICNENTVSAMISISGDDRYDGKLNIMWGAYGTVPMVGVFHPSMACSGRPPRILNKMYDYTLERQAYAKDTQEGLYISKRVREIQDYAFAAEDYAFTEYANLLTEMPAGLNETELLITLEEFINHLVSIIADMYVNKTSTLPEYVEPYSIKFEPHTTQTTSSSPTSFNETITTTNSLPDYTTSSETILIIAIGGLAGISIPLIGYYLLNHILNKNKKLS